MEVANFFRAKLKSLAWQILGDGLYLKALYWLKYNKHLRFDSVNTFTEKIQWLKLYDPNKDLYLYADKLHAKQIVSAKLGQEFVIPTLKVFNSYKDVSLESLPNEAHVIKTNHDSGGVILVKKKKLVNIELIKAILKTKMHRKFYVQAGEYEYKLIRPKIFAEQLVQDQSGNSLLNDYKIHCFHGEPLYIQTIFDRKEGVKENWFDTNWNELDMWYFSADRKMIERPEKLDEMLEIARKLSKEFIYVRIDLYESFGKIYFGEFTFRPYGGFMKWNDPKWDTILGSHITLPLCK